MKKIMGSVLAASVLLAGCQGTMPSIGSKGADTVATGAAGGATSANANAQMETCTESLGTLAVEEKRDDQWYYYFQQNYGLQSTVPLLRLMIQQSNCFVVVERGRALDNMMYERGLEESGEMRGGSNFGKGQMVAADYTLIPSVAYSQKGSGGLGAAVGSISPLAGYVAGSLKVNDAATVLTMIDNRSGVQLASAQGSSRNMDFGGLGAVVGGAYGRVSGYSNTPQQKVLVAAFMDSYNQMVRAVRNYQAQTVRGGLGAGGRLGVDGGSTPASRELNSR
jgi:curli biogenesis system outer membrane secretion channel CsgG